MRHPSSIEAASVLHGYSESRGRVESREEEREVEPEREKRKNQRKILERPVRKWLTALQRPGRAWACEGVAVTEGIALPMPGGGLNACRPSMISLRRGCIFTESKTRRKSWRGGLLKSEAFTSISRRATATISQTRVFPRAQWGGEPSPTWRTLQRTGAEATHRFSRLHCRKCEP